jgi:hypothetical protein
MADEIWNRVIAHLAEREDYLRLFDRFRMRPDAWLKVEVLAALTKDRGSRVSDIRLDRQGCDVWFKAGGQDFWLGIRGLITSYAGSGPHARPTIASGEEVSREMDKLTGLATLGGGTPALLLVAFPFGPEPRERSEWSAQMLRFEGKGFEPVEQRTITTNAGRECRIYLFVRGKTPFD